MLTVVYSCHHSFHSIFAFHFHRAYTAYRRAPVLSVIAPAPHLNTRGPPVQCSCGAVSLTLDFISLSLSAFNVAFYGCPVQIKMKTKVSNKCEHTNVVAVLH